jgi:hypothetical protein
VTEFAAGITRGAHFAQDRVERNIAGEFVEIIVAPDDRIRADQAVARTPEIPNPKISNAKEIPALKFPRCIGGWRLHIGVWDFDRPLV